MKKYLLGIDIGTSACKAVVFRFDGTVAASADSDYPIYYPKKGWAEQDPKEWWQGACKAVKQVLEKGNIKGEEIAGIGVDGQSWSAVALDKSGEVLTNTPIWMDTRAKDICEERNSKIGFENIFEISGNPLQPSYTTAKILWYKRNLPEVYQKIDKILQCNSYIVYKLTGKITMDVSQGYGLHCFNMRTKQWDEKMCERLGITRSFLPDLFSCSEVVGAVTQTASEKTGLSIGTPVVAGGLDAACGTLGAGVVHPGDTQEQGGQAGGMSICLDTYQADPSLILSCHVVPGRCLLQGGTTGGGGAMRWFEREFGDYERMMEVPSGESSLVQMNHLAKKVPAGSEGMIFLPYMSGERSPIWNPSAKGMFYGLDFSKTKGHFIRAVMEGVAYSLRHNLETAKNCGAKVAELRAMGGSANSLLWTQIKADVTQKTIKVPASDTATALGAAILAGVGTGVYESCEQAVENMIKITRIHHPNQANQKHYDQSYKLYLELYDQLKQTMEKQGSD